MARDIYVVVGVLVVLAVVFGVAGFYGPEYVTGQALNTRDSCDDSDDKNHYVRGYAQGKLNDGDFKIWDFCQSQDILVEQTCTPKYKPTSYELNCEYGCVQGRCLQRPN